MVTAQTISSHHPTLKQRLTQYLWGYDFFISYHWASGGKYAVSLAQQLRQRHYDVFLDRSDYADGDDWKEVGEIALRNTQRLVLIATREAVLSSKPVEHEIRVFTSRQRQIVPLQFGDHYSEQEKAGSYVLSKFPDTKLFIEDTRDSLAVGPSPETVDRLIQTYGVLRRRNFRALLSLIPAMIVAVFSIFAFLSWGAALHEAQVAKESEEEAIAERNTAIDAEKTSKLILDVVEASAQSQVAVHGVLIDAFLVAIKHLEERKDDGVAANLINSELADLYIKRAWHLDHQHQYQEAINQYERALELLEEIRPDTPGDPEHELRESFVMNNTANTWLSLGQIDKAIELHKINLAKRQDILARFSDSFEARRQIGVSLSQLSTALLNKGDRVNGVEVRTSAMQHEALLWKDYPNNRWVGLNYSHGFSNLAIDLLENGDQKGALAARLTCYEVRKKLYEDAKAGVPSDDNLGLFNFEISYGKICCQIASLMVEIDPNSEDVNLSAFFANGLSIMERLHHDDPSNPEYKEIFEDTSRARKDWHNAIE